jgi:hypothetical protein
LRLTEFNVPRQKHYLKFFVKLIVLELFKFDLATGGSLL